jgi:hypothetical protein
MAINVFTFRSNTSNSTSKQAILYVFIAFNFQFQVLLQVLKVLLSPSNSLTVKIFIGMHLSENTVIQGSGWWIFTRVALIGQTSST